MAIAHLNRQHVRRSQGASVVAKAAYNAREQIYDARTGTTHDYTRHQSKCIFEGLYPPTDAPEWAADRGELWNHAETAERRKDAQLAQSLDIALPHELTHEQNRWLLQDFVRENFTRKGLAADVTIHAPSKDMDSRNIHAHILVPDRTLSGDGFAATKPQKNRTQLREELNGYRQSWERLANHHLERHGHEARIDMGRTRDGDSIHFGKAARGMEARGVETDRGDERRERDALAAARAEVAELEALQREAFRRQDQERAGGTWDGEYTPRLDTLRQQDRDPVLTPEEARARWAARLRGLSEEPELAAGQDRRTHGRDRDPARERASPERRPEDARTQGHNARRSWTSQPVGWDGLTPEQQGHARRSWEAWTTARDKAGLNLPDYVAYVQSREASRKAAEQPAPPRKLSPVAPDGSADVADERRAWARRLREMDTQPPPEARRRHQPPAGRQSIQPRDRSPHAWEPAVSQLRAVVAAGRERLHALGARLETAYASIMARVHGRASSDSHAGIAPGGFAREDNSSRKVNAEAAAEARAAVRRESARQAYAAREQAREFDRHQDETERQNAARARHSIWSEELRLSEVEAAAERLRRSLDRPGPDPGRENTL